MLVLIKLRDLAMQNNLKTEASSFFCQLYDWIIYLKTTLESGLKKKSKKSLLWRVLKLLIKCNKR